MFYLLERTQPITDSQTCLNMTSRQLIHIKRLRPIEINRREEIYISHVSAVIKFNQISRESHPHVPKLILKISRHKS